ncbi:PEP-CTERM sorting domain-containing protein [Massilia sp. LXY-6]|uniref:PEP-CTERM sorting domain-containing protein n=1 Tax=Massilia sp. LXY-6 TaxID=3379823 RepID=UPI003EDFD1AE
MNRSLPALALLLPLITLVPSAQAQVSIVTGASNLRYTLSDLKPGDGVAPELRFGGSTASQFLQASLHAYHGLWERVDDYRVNLVDDSANATLLENRWGDGASVQARFDLGAGLRDWQGSAASFAPRTGIQSFETFGSSRSPVQAFELSPHASMTVYIDIDMVMSSGRDSVSSQYGYGSATLYGVLGAMPALRETFAEGVGQDMPGLERTLSRTLSLSFSNDDDAWMGGSFGWRVDSVTNVWVAYPIPEPGAWAMYLAGAALLAGAGRRRQCFVASA